MTLRARLTWLVATLLAAVSLLIGGSAVQIAYLSGLHSVDGSLDSVATRASQADENGLASALYAASLQQQAIAVALLPAQGALTWVHGEVEADFSRSAIASVGQRDAATLHDGSPYRVRVARLADGDLVVLAADLTSLQSERASNLRIVLLLSVLLAMLGAAGSRWLVRRDLERIRQLTRIADDIAAGGLHTQIPDAVGVSEVDALAASLQRMVMSLTGAFEQLQASHAHLRTFLGDVSHELRTPLTVVRGYVELLQSDASQDPQLRDRALQRALAEMDRMQDLITDLLLLAEFSERPTPVTEEVAIDAIVRDAVADLSTLQPERPVRLEQPEHPLTVVGDRRALTSLVTNILGNVRRHTPADAAVQVVLARQADGWSLNVDDGGPGLTEQQYAVDLQDPERFSRMRSETTGGSGLGLRLVATVVHMHGGALQLRPSQLGGLAVHCTFPSHPKFTHVADAGRSGPEGR